MIEDISPLGASYIDKDDEWKPIILAHPKKFLEIFKLQNKVDCLLTTSRVSREKYIWFINRAVIDEYIKSAEDYANCKFVGFKPHIIGFKVAGPNGRDNDQL